MRVTPTIVPVVSVPPFVALPDGVARASETVNGVRIAMLSTDRASAEGRALLVPGFTGSKEDFIAVLPILGAAGIHAVAVDLAGQCDSGGNTSADRYSLQALAADVVDLSRTIWPEGSRPHLVGHSLGGLIARAAVLDTPPAFASLALIASGPGAVPDQQQPALVALQHLLPQTDLADVWEAKQALDASKGLPVPAPDIQEFLRNRWLRNNPVGLRTKAGILLTESDRTAQLAAERIPSLVVCGSDDDVWPPALQESMARALGAGHEEITGVGHSPTTEAPELTGRILLDFWASEG